MYRNNNKQWLNFTPLQLMYFNCFAVISFLGLSFYIDYIKPMPLCALCLTLRALLLLLSGIALSIVFMPKQRYIAYPFQLALSLGGFLLSLRQVYIETMTRRLTACPRTSGNAIQAIFKWLAKGAPACKKTPLIAGMSFSIWACIAFAILSVIAFQLYYKLDKKR